MLVGHAPGSDPPYPYYNKFCVCFQTSFGGIGRSGRNLSKIFPKFVKMVKTGKTGEVNSARIAVEKCFVEEGKGWGFFRDDGVR
jgi:hypothetical protein